MNIQIIIIFQDLYQVQLMQLLRIQQNIKNYVIAKAGVYAVKIYQKNKNFSLKGIANLGYRPTFNQKKILLEVYIFNFSGNLYNKHLTIEFIHFIRKEKKFKNINQLRKQINLDLKSAKKKLN